MLLADAEAAATPPAAVDAPYFEIVRAKSHRLPGFMIAIDEDGRMVVKGENGRQIRQVQLPSSISSTLFLTAQMAEPGITAMPVKDCGHEPNDEGQTYLRFNGVSSPDLRCNATGMLGVLWSTVSKSCKSWV